MQLTTKKEFSKILNKNTNSLAVYIIRKKVILTNGLIDIEDEINKKFIETFRKPKEKKVLTERICTKCHIKKNVSEILTAICLDCKKLSKEKSKLKGKEYNKNYKNPKHEENLLKNRLKNAELKKIRLSKITEEDILLKKAKQKEVKRLNNKRNSVKQKEWRLKNKTHINNYLNKKRSEDSIFKFKRNIRTLICNSFKKTNFIKCSKTENILGCNIEELKKHIEFKFTTGMSWENRNEWHIDHKKPLALAKTEQEVIELNHYTNLQPLWKLDNLKKGCKYGII